MFTNELQDATGTCTALCVLSEHSGILDATHGDEHVQELWWGGPEDLLEELQRRCDHIMIPVLRVV